MRTRYGDLACILYVITTRAPRSGGLYDTRWGVIGCEDVLDGLVGPLFEFVQFGGGLVQLIRVPAPVVAPLPGEATVPVMGVGENSAVVKTLPICSFTGPARASICFAASLACWVASTRAAGIAPFPSR